MSDTKKSVYVGQINSVLQELDFFFKIASTPADDNYDY